MEYRNTEAEQQFLVYDEIQQCKEMLGLDSQVTTEDNQYNKSDVNTVPLSCSQNCAFTSDINAVGLPKGKDTCFFVSYSREDREIVFSYVEELERRFNLSCVFADRDFKPGKDITESVKEGMARSLKVLLFLSQKFHESPWRKLETEFQLITSIENGTSCVIPVMLENCEIPATLMSLTYVDATRPNVDVPEKIANALVQTFTSDEFLPHNLNNALSNYQNGCSLILSAQKYPATSLCRRSKIKFDTSPDLFEKMKSCKVEVPQELLQQSINVVNSAMYPNNFVKRCYLLFVFIIFLNIVVFVGNCLAWAYYADHDINGKLVGIEQYVITNVLVIALATVIVFLFIAKICLPACCSKTQRNKALQKKLWNIFADKYIDNNVLLIFSRRKNKEPELHIMRYNMSRCKDYLKTFIKDRYPDKDVGTAELEADCLIKGYVQDILPALVDDFDSLPEAPFNRHNVKKGKMCLCQYLEHRASKRLCRQNHYPVIPYQ